MRPFRKLALLIFSALLFCNTAFAQNFPPLIVEEADGSPTGVTTKIKFSNGTVSRSGTVATVTIIGVGGGDVTGPAGAVADNLASFSDATGKVIKDSGIQPSANGISLIEAADYAAMKGLLDLEIGTDIQAYDADLTTYAGITPTANAQTLLGETFAQMQASLSVDDLITLSGVAEGSANLATFTGTTIADNVTIKAALQALETTVEDKQASDVDLTTWAGITPGANVGTFLATSSSANLATAVSDEIGTAGKLVFSNSPTFDDDIQLGLAGATGILKLYSEQGVTDYTASLYPNTAMTSAASFFLPVDEPTAQSFLSMSTSGVMSFVASHAGTNIANDLEEEVTEGSLADSVIVSADIKDGTIAAGDLATNIAITTSGTLNVTGTITGNLTGAVTGNASTATALAGGEVDPTVDTEAEIEAITGAKFGASKVVTAGYLWVADGTDFESVPMSGDVSIASGGATTVANDSHDHSAAGSTVTINAADITDKHAGTNITADLEEEVTEDSLADSTIVSADIKNGTIVVADTAITAGRSLTWSTDDLIADAELYTDTKCIYWENPVATDDFKSIWRPKGYAATITSIWAESDQTVTFMLQVDDGSPADVDSVDLAPAAGTAEDTSLDGDATLADGDRLDLAVTSVANTPTWCSICWTFTKDD